MSNWAISDSRKAYNIENWGDGYFDICHNGNLSVAPGRNNIKIDIDKLSQQLTDSGLTFPILIRFLDIIHSHIDRIESAFAAAMTKHNYSANHKIIYPIKVNQQQDVIEEVISHGKDRVGLEAGSKPELLAVLAKSLPGSTVICNGYKDEEYVRLALLGQQIGLKVFIVIEKTSEIELISRVVQQLNITPLLGIRARLASAGSGNWQNSGGEDSKFGLTTSQIVKAIERLSQLNLSQSLQLLHFHIGSQITDLSHIKSGACEIARYFQQISLLNINISVIDVGGGLGVDYEGSKSTSHCSTNYSIQQYAEAIVSPIASICAKEKLHCPDIICESGRAITAQHAIILSNIIDYDRQEIVDTQSVKSTHWIISKLKQMLLEPITDISTAFAETQELYLQIQGQFKTGGIDLKTKAGAEGLYRNYCHRILSTPRIRQLEPDIFNILSEKLADKLFCNLSIFQSMPDIWGIEQIFPIMPIHRLNQQPDRRAILMDITCDSDGQIKDYVDSTGLERFLPAHRFETGNRYVFGFFMVGAYQEILGDLHNLFGDTHSVNIKIEGDGFVIKNTRHGDTISDVLKTVHFHPKQVVESILSLFTEALPPESDIDATKIQSIIKNSLKEYTYLHPKQI
ncbi:MAG: biosynthetic arginine decarboxylase [Gammaproteobacteria bacterium]|nr:MAG: biosynthetic arginine decarboxylase [Gammaproteobacteria bacterium]